MNKAASVDAHFADHCYNVWNSLLLLCLINLLLLFWMHFLHCFSMELLVIIMFNNCFLIVFNTCLKSFLINQLVNLIHVWSGLVLKAWQYAVHLGLIWFSFSFLFKWMKRWDRIPPTFRFFFNFIHLFSQVLIQRNWVP